MRFVSINVVHPYSNIDTATTWKKSHFIISDRLDFHMIDILSIAFYALVKSISTSISVDEMLLSNWSNDFRGLSLRVEMSPFCLRQLNESQCRMML